MAAVAFRQARIHCFIVAHGDRIVPRSCLS
jgi:hypothetical protein